MKKYFTVCKVILDTIHPSVYLTHMSSREVIKILKAGGWYKVGQNGRDHQYKHPTKPGRVTIPHPVKDIPKGTLGSIKRQSGLSFED